jgi:membrane protease YdiL (CAAX protease family)
VTPPIASSAAAWVAAALTILLLYLLLTDGQRVSWRRAARPFLFALLGGVTVLLLAGAREQRAAATGGDMGAAFRAYTEGMLEAKRSSVRVALGPDLEPRTVRARAIERYRAAVAAAPEAARFRRELAILLAEQGRRQEALREMKRVVGVLRERHLEARAREEEALWPAIYERPVTSKAAPALRARVEKLQLGWFRYLVLAQLNERAGLRGEAKTLRRAAGDEALFQQLVLGGLVLGGLLVGTAGVCLSVYLAFQVLRRRWKLSAGAFEGPAPLLWEGILLFLFLYAAAGLLRPLFLRATGPGTTPEQASALYVALMMAIDLLCLVPLLYVGAQLRRQGLSLAAIGLARATAVKEIGYGLIAYVAILPWLILVANSSEWLGRRFFPEVAPPFHPIQTLTLAASSGWTRLGLFVLLAVGAPLLEEVYFRGMLYGALRRRFGIAVGLIGSGALFSLLHPQLPLGFLPIMFLGVVLAALYEWRRSLLPSIALHALNNSLVFLLLTLLFPPLD